MDRFGAAREYEQPDGRGPHNGGRPRREPIYYAGETVPTAATGRARMAHPGGKVKKIFPPGHDPERREHRFYRSSEQGLPSATPGLPPLASTAGARGRGEQLFPFGPPPHLLAAAEDGDQEFTTPFSGARNAAPNYTSGSCVGSEGAHQEYDRHLGAVDQVSPPAFTHARTSTGAGRHAAVDSALRHVDVPDIYEHGSLEEDEALYASSDAGFGSMRADFEGRALPAVVGYDSILEEQLRAEVIRRISDDAAAEAAEEAAEKAAKEDRHQLERQQLHRQAAADAAEEAAYQRRYAGGGAPPEGAATRSGVQPRLPGERWQGDPPYAGLPYGAEVSAQRGAMEERYRSWNGQHTLWDQRQSGPGEMDHQHVSGGQWKGEYAAAEQQGAPFARSGLEGMGQQNMGRYGGSSRVQAPFSSTTEEGAATAGGPSKRVVSMGGGASRRVVIVRRNPVTADGAAAGSSGSGRVVSRQVNQAPKSVLGSASEVQKKAGASKRGRPEGLAVDTVERNRSQSQTRAQPRPAPKPWTLEEKLNKSLNALTGAGAKSTAAAHLLNSSNGGRGSGGGRNTTARVGGRGDGKVVVVASVLTAKAHRKIGFQEHNSMHIKPLEGSHKRPNIMKKRAVLEPTVEMKLGMSLSDIKKGHKG